MSSYDNIEMLIDGLRLAVDFLDQTTREAEEADQMSEAARYHDLSMALYSFQRDLVFDRVRIEVRP